LDWRIFDPANSDGPQTQAFNIMQTKILIVALAAFLVSTAALAHGDHSSGGQHAYGRPGDPAKPARVIQITMREGDGKMEFVPNKIQIKTGEQIKFVVRNSGELDHEIVLATLDENLKHAAVMAKNPEMQHDDPNGKRIAPNGTGAILWKFTKAGEFDYACLIPGHREAGMFGTIIVK
jgi:uncharacterized cupredoxin-like copper-binding protein